MGGVNHVRCHAIVCHRILTNAQVDTIIRLGPRPAPDDHAMIRKRYPGNAQVVSKVRGAVRKKYQGHDELLQALQKTGQEDRLEVLALLWDLLCLLLALRDLVLFPLCLVLRVLIP
ncbi:hypothetical protein NDU88_004792 [Pleurodeles waltl]|uniref:Uncharacterized protein n=1 Tax=Pleurodeles waltl TaxID=8319 RepID=A0AAV7LMD6_PLEWA|nr:hypothetical protein NDU88_004792 [Pleurodeles waltl]